MSQPDIWHKKTAPVFGDRKKLILFCLVCLTGGLIGLGTRSFTAVTMSHKSQFDVAPRYYSTRYGEIDFLLQNSQEIIPAEVKCGADKSAPTFKKYIAEKAPETAIRFSEMGYVKNGAITNLPLYLAGSARRLL